MGLIGFFKAFGSVFGRIFGIVKKVVPEEQLLLGKQLVAQAALEFADNSEKREWCVAVLVGKGIPESVARLIVELAVQALKHEVGSVLATGAA